MWHNVGVPQARRNNMARKYDKMKVLEHIFMQKTSKGKKYIGKDIDFTLAEVGEAIVATGGTQPTSWSNFVLDLTRKKKPIDARLPKRVIAYGYDLRKRTGSVPENKSDRYCGTFVYRGTDDDGKTIPLQDWLEWGDPSEEITIKNKVPSLVQNFIANDEASLFSVIDYCDVLTKVLGKKVYRVQSPMKWQPNEIDGCYVAKEKDNIFVYPVEAKAISTKDDINLVQINGQYNVFIEKYTRDGLSLIVRPVAARMEKYGMLFAILEHNPTYDSTKNREARMFNIEKTVKVKLDPPVSAWEI